MITATVELSYLLERGAVYAAQAHINAIGGIDFSQVVEMREACERAMLDAFPNAIFDKEAKVFTLTGQIRIVVYATVRRSA